MSNKSKHDMAEYRTDWAYDRTLLAKERTFAACGRTGISAMAAGLGHCKAARFGGIAVDCPHLGIGLDSHGRNDLCAGILELSQCT